MRGVSNKHCLPFLLRLNIHFHFGPKGSMVGEGRGGGVKSQNLGHFFNGFSHS